MSAFPFFLSFPILISQLNQTTQLNLTNQINNTNQISLFKQDRTKVDGNCIVRDEASNPLTHFLSQLIISSFLTELLSVVWEGVELAGQGEVVK